VRARIAKLGLTAVACALVCVPGSVSADAAAAPICVPDAVNASAALPGTSLLATPAPGTRDAMPQTQLSFLGAGGEVTRLAVHGSISGSHDGSLERYSQGDGASFVPSAPFVAGEIVSVAGSWTSGGVEHPFAYAFTVGDPDPIARLPEPTHPAGPPGTVLHFASAPGIDPASLTVTLNSPAARRSGDIFIAAYPGPGATGPAIFDPRGRLVWFRPLPPGRFATNVRVQRYRGRPVLTWWQGVISQHGFGYGEGEILSTAYRPIATVVAGNGLAEDLHEFTLEPDGAALITAWKPLYCDLEGVGGAAESAVYDASFQEIDIRTGLVRYEWDSLDHVPLTDSYMPASGARTAWPYDWFHLNSIARDGGGNLLISARSTWAVYDLDAATGVVRWRLGGRRPSFTMGPGTLTAWQHDAQPLGRDTVSVFDNGGPPSALRRSRGVVLRIDPGARTATLVVGVAISTPIFAQTQGDFERLPDGNWWIGWGNVNESSEVSAGGRHLFEAHTPAGSESYRTLRFRWSGRPATPPQVAVRRGAHGPPRVYVSWNGATGVARWRLEAGSSPSSLENAGSVASGGFETVMPAPRAAAVVRAVALDAHGRVLAASLPVTVPRPGH
jgi:Arylsulfotransferase (ASST)